MSKLTSCGSESKSNITAEWLRKKSGTEIRQHPLNSLNSNLGAPPATAKSGRESTKNSSLSYDVLTWMEYPALGAQERQCGSIVNVSWKDRVDVCACLIESSDITIKVF